LRPRQYFIAERGSSAASAEWAESVYLNGAVHKGRAWTHSA
jgi:hypothetical protein